MNKEIFKRFNQVIRFKIKRGHLLNRSIDLSLEDKINANSQNRNQLERNQEQELTILEKISSSW